MWGIRYIRNIVCRVAGKRLAKIEQKVIPDEVILRSESSAPPVKSIEYFRKIANRSLTVCRAPHRSPQFIRVQPPCERTLHLYLSNL